MKDEEFRKCYKAMVEWEPFPAEKARQLLKRILAILYEPMQPRLEDHGTGNASVFPQEGRDPPVIYYYRSDQK